MGRRRRHRPLRRGHPAHQLPDPGQGGRPRLPHLGQRRPDELPPGRRFPGPRRRNGPVLHARPALRRRDRRGPARRAERAPGSARAALRLRADRPGPAPADPRFPRPSSAEKRISTVERRLCVHCGNCAAAPIRRSSSTAAGFLAPIRRAASAARSARSAASPARSRCASAARPSARRCGRIEWHDNGIALIVERPDLHRRGGFRPARRARPADRGRPGGEDRPARGAARPRRAPDRRPGQAGHARPDQRPHALLQHARARPGQGRPGPRFRRRAAQPLVAARPQADARRHLLQRPDHDAGRRPPAARRP